MATPSKKPADSSREVVLAGRKEVVVGSNWRLTQLAWQSLIYMLMVVYVLVAPYTKVEESFNIQATHDIITLGPQSLEQFDHLQFPGVVPRTFLGSLLLSILVYPFHFILNRFTFGTSSPENKLLLLLITRITLGTVMVFTWLKLGSRASGIFGSSINLWYVIFTGIQFHPLFWGSRLLPNMFALVFTNIGFSYWLEGLVFTFNKNGEEHRQRRLFMVKFLSCMVPASVIFRSEVGFLTGFVLMIDFVFSFTFYLSPRRVSRIVRATVLLVALSLFVTIVVDSYFWKGSVYANEFGLLWPEGAVFYFNAILGKSQEWGVLPFHTYFTVFLPKVLGLAYIFSLLGFGHWIVSSIFQTSNPNLSNLDPITVCFNLVQKSLMLPSLLYVAFMSCLGHKEWRFVVYILPIFNLSAAVTVTKLFRSLGPDHNIIKRSFQTILTGLICLNLTASFVLVFLSSLNYPGGEALKLVHEVALSRGDSAASVHIHVSAAMSGASRFGEIGQGWKYDKNETVSLPDLENYRYLIAHPNLQLNLSKVNWELVGEIYGLENVSRLALKPWADRWLCTLFLNIEPSRCEFPKTKHQYFQTTVNSNLTPTRLRVISNLESFLPIHVNFVPKQLVFRKY